MQRRRELLEVAVHDLVDLVQRQVDPVVGDSSLRKVVRADPLGPITAADQRFSLRRFLGMRRLPLLIEQSRCQHRHRAIAVPMLRPVVLAFDDEARRQVRDPHGRVGLVDVLSAGAAGAKRVDPQVGRIDRDVLDRIGFGEDRDRARRGVDPPLRFGLGNALHAMRPRFEFEFRVGALRR